MKHDIRWLMYKKTYFIPKHSDGYHFCLSPVCPLNSFHLLEGLLQDQSFWINNEFRHLISRFNKQFIFRNSIEIFSLYILSISVRNNFSFEDVGPPKLTKIISVGQQVFSNDYSLSNHQLVAQNMFFKFWTIPEFDFPYLMLGLTLYNLYIHFK